MNHSHAFSERCHDPKQAATSQLQAAVPSCALVSVQMATPVDEAALIATLRLAFAKDPALRWLYPDPYQFFLHFPGFVRAFGGRALGSQTADIVKGPRADLMQTVVGAALWLPPGIPPDEEALMHHFHRSLLHSQQAEVSALLEQMALAHPSQPHWYLALLGVDPLHQGQGVGSQLLQAGLARCDRDCSLAYLESSNPANIPFYERYGFELLATLQVGSTPPIFPMLRQPRSTGS